MIYDSPTVDEGNLLMYGELSTPRAVEKDTIMTIKENFLKLSVKNPPPNEQGDDSHWQKNLIFI